MFDGVKTGYKDLDACIGGFKNGELYVIIGCPASGKTTLAINLVRKIAIEQRKKCAFYSLEHIKKEIESILIKQIDNCPGSILDIEKNAHHRIEDVPIMIYDISSYDYLDEEKEIKETFSSGDIEMIAIDYLQLLSFPNDKGGHKGVIFNIKRFTKLAKEFNCPIILLSQLSRRICRTNEEFTKITSPYLQDMYDWANNWIWLYREGYGDLTMPNQQFELIVDKECEGHTGNILLDFEREFLLLKDH